MASARMLLVALLLLAVSSLSSACDIGNDFDHVTFSSSATGTSGTLMVAPGDQAFALATSTADCALLISGSFTYGGNAFNQTILNCDITKGPAACGDSCPEINSMIIGTVLFDTNCHGGNFSLGGNSYDWTSSVPALTASFLIVSLAILVLLF